MIIAEVCKLWGVLQYFITGPSSAHLICVFRHFQERNLRIYLTLDPDSAACVQSSPPVLQPLRPQAAKRERIFKLVMLSWTGKTWCDSRATTRWDLYPQKLSFSVCERDFSLFIFPGWDLKGETCFFFYNSISLQVSLVFLNFLPKPK